jgi:hypothetical protein
MSHTNEKSNVNRSSYIKIDFNSNCKKRKRRAVKKKEVYLTKVAIIKNLYQNI